MGLVVAASTLAPGAGAQAQTSTRLSDPNTTFHRLYITGAGHDHVTWHEENRFKDDLGELQGDIERPGVTQKAESTSQTLAEPSEQDLRTAIQTLQEIAMPGEEVTIVFIGHGGGTSQYGQKEFFGEAEETWDEHFWLNDANNNEENDTAGETLTDDELAAMLVGEPGFRQSVTLVLVMHSCWGGGFTGGGTDVAESDHLAVIGANTTCPLDSPIPAGYRPTETLTEAVADGAGEKEADANGDGTVTANELKAWLREGGWKLGVPDDEEPGRRKRKLQNGKSACVPPGPGSCALPDLRPARLTLRPESRLALTGTRFGREAGVRVGLLRGDGRRILDRDRTNQRGRVRLRVDLPELPEGDYLLFLQDRRGNLDWELVQVPAG